MKEERPGWKWHQTSSGGYWTKVTGEKHSHKLPLFCPHCSRPTGTIDDDCLLTCGFCKTCYVMHVEDRQTPTIDLEYYKSKLKSR